MFPYLGKMCDLGRKAGVIRQRRQFFFDPECSFVKAQDGGHWMLLEEEWADELYCLEFKRKN